jgi:hypothetical protein
MQKDEVRRYEYDEKRISLALYYTELTVFQKDSKAAARKLYFLLDLKKVGEDRKFKYDIGRVNLAFYYIRISIFKEKWNVMAQELISYLNLNEIELRLLRHKLNAFFYQRLTTQLVPHR